MRLSLSLFYLLILFLPTQLARHFFWDFTTISGIRSDYLTPTVYFTDVIAFFLIVNELFHYLMSLRGAQRRGNLSTHLSSHTREILRMARNDKLYTAFIITGYLLFNVIFIATNQWAAFYKLIKILEFIFLGVAISRLKPKLVTIINMLSLSVFYSSVIAIWQFLIQKSIGGIFWWLGERTFYAGTPGIAVFSYNGSLMLRPYATFPHPNVLGGFLALVLPLMFFSLCHPDQRDTGWYPRVEGSLANARFNRVNSNNSRDSSTSLGITTSSIRSIFFKIWLIFYLTVGLVTLILTFSRTAWLTAGIGFVLLFTDKIRTFIGKIQTKKKTLLFFFYLLIFISVLIPVLLPRVFLANNQYWQERVILIKAAIEMISNNLIFGVGLNNSAVRLKEFINYIPGIFIFQPIHNVFLLILAEIGLAGFGVFLWQGSKIFSLVSKLCTIYFVALMQLFFLGLFDHYLYTLQQGQLLLTIFVALAVSSRPSEARGMTKRILSF